MRQPHICLCKALQAACYKYYFLSCQYIHKGSGWITSQARWAAAMGIFRCCRKLQANFVQISKLYFRVCEKHNITWHDMGLKAGPALLPDLKTPSWGESRCPCVVLRSPIWYVSIVFTCCIFLNPSGLFQPLFFLSLFYISIFITFTVSLFHVLLLTVKHCDVCFRKVPFK